MFPCRLFLCIKNIRTNQSANYKQDIQKQTLINLFTTVSTQKLRSLTREQPDHKLNVIQKFVGVTIRSSPSILYTAQVANQYYINKIMSQTKSRKPNPQRPVDSVALDKGKRHFFYRQKKDYGFFQSEEPYAPLNFYAYNPKVQQPQHRRRHSTIGNRNDEGYQLHHQTRNSVSQNSMGIIRELTPKKELNLVSHNIEVKLPAINKNHNRVSTQDSQQLNYKQANTAKPQDVSPEKEFTSRLNQRVRTQPVVRSERGRKVRFSPTYVCSFNNPLPTFKLYDNGTTRPLYQYGFSDERQ